MELAAFQEELPEAHRGVVGVGEECVLDDDASATSGLEHLDEVLKEEEGCLAGADRKILLDFLSLLAAEGWIGKDDVVAVFFLNIRKILCQSVGVDDVGSFYAVQDHVHNSYDVGQRLLFLAVEGFFGQGLHVGGAQAGLGFQVIEGFAKEVGRSEASPPG